MDLPPVVPVLNLVGLLGPLDLGDGVGEELEEGVGEALHHLVHLGAPQLLLVLLTRHVVLLQLLHRHLYFVVKGTVSQELGEFKYAF